MAEFVGTDGDDELPPPGKDDAGRDRLEGLGGNDRLSGGPRSDTLDGGDGGDALHGGDGDAEGDRYSGVGNVVGGGAGDDTLHAGSHVWDDPDDGAGDDVLHGGDGWDVLYGLAGNNVLTGGDGDDLFYFLFEHGRQNDRITDFENGADSLVLLGFADYFDYYDLVGVITAAHSGASVKGVVIDLEAHGGGTILLENFDAADLDYTDFHVI